jgi:hypothetical protein
LIGPPGGSRGLVAANQTPPKHRVLLDPTFTTWERFGLPGLGTVILIDPDGNLVKGDETVLAEKLQRH